MKYVMGIITLMVLACANEKTIQLPKIEHSETTEIHDISAAYLFYDETQKDSVEFNRKNLIGTTNWLVNVDKRLTLKQAIPHIKYLQDKRRNSQMHKNENAKNYFTCNDISRNNLGFIEFTEVKYKTPDEETINSEEDSDSILFATEIDFDSKESINIHQSDGNHATMNWKDLLKNYNNFDFELNKDSIYISFDKNLPFQDYITFKSFLKTVEEKGNLISKEELISN
ncbi:hypothetical protein [Tamlana crocina]|uniref:Lipoprotein n=1 Tax=Tamlana crocina TaxID=393006 RepID=A0ABX1D8I5_9FLAO|nr:hypothetical protein [Tamlana crocina]NJX14585.1 hypothetical protein [Tamlana crocina]